MQCYLSGMQTPKISCPSLDLTNISIIAAMTSARVIGSQQGLPWHLPEDLRLFKSKTMGKTIIMGRKTYQSIGRPLPGRQNIVLSRTSCQLQGVQVCTSFKESLVAAARHRKPTFIIGGAELYKEALPIATELHISWIDKKLPGDVFFPDFDLTEWTVCSESIYSGFSHVHYRRTFALETVCLHNCT
jgi:dihydrofolate reductase